MEMITLKYQDQTSTINPLGGGIMEYYRLINGHRRDIIYGYDIINDKVGSMGDVLFPFPGRVEKSKYSFEGQKYKLSGVRVKDGHAIHGFAKMAEWQVEGQTESQVKLSFTIKEAEYAKKGYPFSVKLSLVYELDSKGLTCRAIVENIGLKSTPFGLGFHPYFTVGTETIDDMLVKIDAEKLVESDKNLKPTGKLLPVSGSEVDFSEPAKIGRRIIDNCFTNLHLAHPEGVLDTTGPDNQNLDLLRDGPGLPRGGRDSFQIHQTTLSNDSGDKVVVWQDESFPYLQVYSADTIGEVHARRGFAVEPQTCTGFAFNVPNMGLKVLRPGEVFEGSWGIILD